MILKVRSTARICYRVFSKCWPDRARKLFASFDHVIQRVKYLLQYIMILLIITLELMLMEWNICQYIRLNVYFFLDNNIIDFTDCSSSMRRKVVSTNDMHHLCYGTGLLSSKSIHQQWQVSLNLLLLEVSW